MPHTASVAPRFVVRSFLQALRLLLFFLSQIVGTSVAFLFWSPAKHARAGAVEWARLHIARDALYRRGNTCIDFLAFLWNPPTDLCVSYVFWHCVARIALPRADANNPFFSMSLLVLNWCSKKK